MSTSIPIHSSGNLVRHWFDKQGLKHVDTPPCFIFSEQSFQPGLNDLGEYFSSGGWISWLGGPGISGIEWPVTADGNLQAHIATFCLSDAQWHPEMKNSWPDCLELPKGFLEIYSDLETYGSSLEDKSRMGWTVRWLETTDGLSLVTPDDYDNVTPSSVCQLGIFSPGFTIPNISDLDNAYEINFDQWESLSSSLQSAWHVQRFEKKSDYPIPFTHIGGGSSWHGYSTVEDLLLEVLPLNVGDRHILLASIESWTTLSGWFGDAGTFEVWIRESDLIVRNFTNVWCMIRTD